MPMRKGSAEIEFLLKALEEGFAAAAWHGPSLRNSLRGLAPDEAAWRPAKGRHNIWEIMVHAAYWKYAVRRRLLRDRMRTFPEPGSNWFARPGEGGRADLRADLGLLDEQHRLLREAVAATPPSRLDESAANSTVRKNILGVAFHDVYHAGQIRLLRKLAKERQRSGGRLRA